MRSKIVREHLNDPAFYDTMSQLLRELIRDRNARALEYEAYLVRIAELAKRVQAGRADDTPEALDTPGRRALYSNLGQDVVLALEIDAAVKRVRSDSWRGVQTKENQIKNEIYRSIPDAAEVERIFSIIFRQTEY